MTDDAKVIAAISHIERHHTGLPLSPDELTEILSLANRRHKARWGDPIFSGKVELTGLYDNSNNTFVGGLSANEKRLITKAYTFLQS